MSQLQPSPSYAQVILPIPLRNQFTYRIPAGLVEEVAIGNRVVVQFGLRKYYAGIVYTIHSNAPVGFDVKDILSVLDDKPLINEFQIRFWDWISSYYMCTLGEIMKAALPAGLKLESETVVTLHPNLTMNRELTGSEEFIMQLLNNHPSLSLHELAKGYKKQDLLKVVKGLVDDGLVTVGETIVPISQPTTRLNVELMPKYLIEEELHKLFDTLNKAPKQLQILMKYIQLSGIFNARSQAVSRKLLLADIPGGIEVLKVLVKKQIFSLVEKNISTDDGLVSSNQQIKKLSDYQHQTLTKILKTFETKPVVLLHGYTASGKTELYIHLIDIEVRQGKQVLYLLPEIALTAQIINRLKVAFGEKVGIYHSKFSDAERKRVWNRMLNNESPLQVILGVRSSVFLPYRNLGLIIVDEEHENSYKQFDPAPRYHARDSAMMLARIHGARTILGTATPSVESYYNAQHDKYGMVELFQRFTNVRMPEITLANLTDARKRRQMKSVFHPRLLEAMTETLERGQQVILFHNRRGFSPYMQCNVCQSIPKCKHCDVSLTYHKNQQTLVCHYCGYTTSRINVCQACGSPTLQMHGFGTEKIEDELVWLFPGRRIARLDLDTARSRKTYENIILGFENQELDILVGTQMVTKGLDFDHVQLVGIIDADQLLNYPDFRAYERSFQLMSQVSGRAGRKDQQGQVIIQTTDPANCILTDVIRNDFQHMYQRELDEREKFSYPPFSKLIQLTVKHKNQNLVDDAAYFLGEKLRLQFGHRVIGPEYPLIRKISNWYQKNILIKIELQLSPSKAKEIIHKLIIELTEHPEFKSVIVQPDVDPM